MSMHNQPLTAMEEEGLRAHGLVVGTASQLSDAFRQGMAWALKHTTSVVPEGCRLVPIIPTVQMLAACTTSKNEILRQEIMRMAAEDYAAILAAAPSVEELLNENKETEMGIIERKHQFGTIQDFQPDDTETEMYILTDCSGVSLESLLERVREKWGSEIQLSEIQIRSEFIHTRCLGYDSFDRSDWDNYLVITKE